jgi:hypothetical protein
MFILLDPACLIIFECGKEGSFNREDYHLFKLKFASPCIIIQFK